MERLERHISGNSEVSADHFLVNPPLKPKAEVADYVESEGILTPRRFSGLQGALSSGKPFIIRGEHPQDYDGASGLGISVVVNDQTLQEGAEKIVKLGTELNWEDFDRPLSDSGIYWDIHRQIIGMIKNTPQDVVENNLNHLDRDQAERYCELIGMDLKDFEKQRSFSYWEFIPGNNQILIADSGIEERYHIFTYPPAETKLRYNYSVIDNGQVVKSGPIPLEDMPWIDFNESIGFYEKIRQLSAFSEKHVPLIETVVLGDKRYFLQYHRSRDFVPADFSLTRSLQSGEVEAGFVRGVTPKEGIICDTRFWYVDDYKLQDEDASFDFHWNLTYSELMTPRRKVQFNTAQDWSEFTVKTIDMHLQKSKLFKPQLSIFLEKDKMFRLVPEIEDFEGDYDNFRVKLNVVSDGRRAIVGRIE